MNAKLVEKREARNLKREEVAEAVGVSAMSIRFYEHGTRVPRADIKKKLAAFYGCEERELFGNTELFGNNTTLEQAARPLVEYLRRNGDARMMAVVTRQGVITAVTQEKKLNGGGAMPKSKIAKYIRRHGLTLSAVARKAGISKQALAKYGEAYYPKMDTLKKVAEAMTALDVPTKVTDLVEVLYQNETPAKDKTAED